MPVNTNNLKIGVIGLGYAGFPMASLLSRKHRVVGFDISSRRVSELSQGIDRCNEVDSADIRRMLASGSVITTDLEQLRDCNFYIVVVPTPVDKDLKPDTSCIISASREVAQVLKPGDIVVYESTVYPGATEEICAPILEKESGLKYNTDFFIGYSPERINPGDKIHRHYNTVKITSGSTPQAARTINDLYVSVLGADNTYPVSSIKVAEACKVVENAQRDINIAFINEITQTLNALNIDTNEVIDAMNTKWNALGFRPGFVGGHCIGIDTYYLIECAKHNNIDTNILVTARSVNESMPQFVVDKVIDTLTTSTSTPVYNANILLLGFTFKENCPDVRNTKVVNIYNAFKQHTPNVTIFDPWANSDTTQNIYGIPVATQQDELSGHRYDAIVLCVAHNCFKHLDLQQLLTDNGFVFDVKGFFPHTGDHTFNIHRI